MQVISLGWGVQSFTLAVMSALGELPRVAAAIHSDTTHERAETYRFANKWTPWLQEHGVKVVTVRPNRSLALESVKVKSVYIPAFTRSQFGNGQLRRQCTQRWKIQPMRKWLRREGGRTYGTEMWLGISMDEAERMRSSDVKYITNRFPLIEKRMTREGCKHWLVEHGIDVPPKSACVFCPYHNAAAWRDMRASSPVDWDEAIRVDELIRAARPPFDLYVHSKRRPLREIGEAIDAQPAFWSEECSGYCFL